MELGPRALGNRSILADPRDVATRDRVNRLKGREIGDRSRRPCSRSAPGVLRARAARARSCSRRRCDPRRAPLPAVVHVDGTARPQTVRREREPALLRAARAFERRTGVPVLLNTSFNAAGEPIVCSPRDAVRSSWRRASTRS